VRQERAGDRAQAERAGVAWARGEWARGEWARGEWARGEWARGEWARGEWGGAPGVTARTVVASILLPLEVPELAGRSLVRCCQLFGIAEGTARVAISRMVAAGELEVSGPGRYRLSGRMLTRHERQQRARHPTMLDWDGSWLLVVGGPGLGRPAYRQLATGLSDRRLGELRTGIWARPANLAGLEDEVTRALGQVPGAAASCLVIRGSLARDGLRDAEAVSKLFDLEGFAERAREILIALERTLPDLEGGRVGALAACFDLAAAAVRQLTADPLLPEVLLPEDWPGPALRATYDAYEEAYRRLLVTWLRTSSP